MNQPFDTQRAILLDVPEPDPFEVTHYVRLAEALEQGDVMPDEQYYLATIGDEALLLPILPMIYYHVAQGSLAGTAWIASFCCLCNAGALFDAHHQGQVYSFGAQGYYDVMVLISDMQTRSYWNHLTGVCLHGPLAGAALQRLSGLMQVRAGEVLLTYPQAHIAHISTMDSETKATAQRWNAVYRLADEPKYGDGLLASKAAEDTRLRQAEMGLGIWTAQTRRFYPIMKLYENQNVIVDRLDGRSVVITLYEEVGLPTVFYFEPSFIKQRGDELLLSATARFRNGLLYVNGKPMKPERPFHNTLRWYAFAALAPGCEIYGHGAAVNHQP